MRDNGGRREHMNKIKSKGKDGKECKGRNKEERRERKWEKRAFEEIRKGKRRYRN